jgi:ubiquitin C-terminal hydrolase
MFGLNNFRGSCWVNACLQAVFRIPEVQARYNREEFDPENSIDKCLSRIWNSNGRDGLRDFFDSVKTTTMPAGEDIGDAHELLQYLCDKLPYLDKLCRFKTADTIQCKTCSYKEVREDSVIEYSITPVGNNTPISECIMNTVKPYEIPEWKCDKCGGLGCTKQQLIGSFPTAMVFHQVFPGSATIDYSSILVLNKKKYALLSVSCFNGAHWWGYGRDMPPGTSWFTLDDNSVIDHGPKQFPISDKMRLLIYYRLEN